ncbi:BQ2448_3047 [Microbotryum intermedium]|uniref:BQ2448_3047 protein n=1 Tax=Microbotryum intermedium TaxID=269621 RepID=A0A238FF81_9BASI|nr:BQ2448_3047 [Microbotryum intermedium]
MAPIIAFLFTPRQANRSHTRRRVHDRTVSSSTPLSDASSFYPSETSDMFIEDQFPRSQSLPYSTPDDVKRQGRLIAQQLQAEEPKQPGLVQMNPLSDLAMI